MRTFSRRNEFSPPKEIRYREELPDNFRAIIWDILRKSLSSSVLCERIDTLFNPYGIDPLPSPSGPIVISKIEDTPELIAAKRYFMGCHWYQVYDLIEDIYSSLYFYDTELCSPEVDEPTAFPFQEKLNRFFEHAGIGWQMVDGLVVARSSRGSEITQRRSLEALQENQMPTSAEHLQCAMKALSVRPESDTNGAISRATNAVECVLGALNGEHLTLGEHLKRHSAKFRPALRKALEGIYGFACDAGPRHGKEGHKPTYDEAEFVVSACAAVCTFLVASRSTEK